MSKGVAPLTHSRSPHCTSCRGHAMLRSPNLVISLPSPAGASSDLRPLRRMCRRRRGPAKSVTRARSRRDVEDVRLVASVAKVPGLYPRLQRKEGQVLPPWSRGGGDSLTLKILDGIGANMTVIRATSRIFDISSGSDPDSTESEVTDGQASEERIPLPPEPLHSTGYPCSRTGSR